MAELATLYLPIEESSWDRLRRRASAVWGVRPDAFDTRWTIFLIRICHWWLGEHALDGLAFRAREALASGADDDLLREFARTETDSALRCLVSETMTREGYPDTQAGGLALYLDIYLGRIVRGVVHPRVGAEAAVWGASGAAVVPDRIFLLDGLTRSWDALDPMGHRPQIERIIVDQARDYCEPRAAAGFRYAG